MKSLEMVHIKKKIFEKEDSSISGGYMPKGLHRVERRKAQGLGGSLCGFSRYQTWPELNLSPQTTFRESSLALTCLPF